jgi:hypothetical protein
MCYFWRHVSRLVHELPYMISIHSNLMIHEPNYRMMYDPQPPHGHMIMFFFFYQERERKRESLKIKRVFETVITTVFHLKIYQNNIFLFF